MGVLQAGWPAPYCGMFHLPQGCSEAEFDLSPTYSQPQKHGGWRKACARTGKCSEPQDVEERGPCFSSESLPDL